jgi:hypothetical protein
MESLGFEWDIGPPGKTVCELADYRKIHGHCNVPTSTAKTPSWLWVDQRTQYRAPRGKTSSMTLSRIQALESLGFDGAA